LSNPFEIVSDIRLYIETVRVRITAAGSYLGYFMTTLPADRAIGKMKQDTRNYSARWYP